MKGRNLIFTGAIALVVGILMMIFHLQLADGGIVYAAGALFVGAGILNMTVFLGSRDKDGRTKMGAFGTAFGWIASAAAVVLGLAMLIFSKAFVALIGFMFAILLLFAAIFQLFLLFFWVPAQSSVELVLPRSDSTYRSRCICVYAQARHSGREHRHDFRRMRLRCFRRFHYNRGLDDRQGKPRRSQERASTIRRTRNTRQATTRPSGIIHRITPLLDPKNAKLPHFHKNMAKKCVFGVDYCVSFEKNHDICTAKTDYASRGVLFAAKNIIHYQSNKINLK